jgi:flap endonuclease-1
MGIRYLNNYLKKMCNKRSIKKINICELKGKTIVIDTSIYIYKFLAENALMENMYLLISIFKHYNIVPVFVFDGKPPDEKIELLKERSKNKEIAEQEYNELMKQLTSNDMNEQDKCKIMEDMNQLKRQFIRVKNRHLNNVKELMDAFGVKYISAEKEADNLCAKLCLSGFAQGCMSDDMDMFVYGCPIVLRHLSLLNHTVVSYDYNKILEDLDMPGKDFKEILMLSQNDYNINNNYNFYETIKWYKNYRKFSSENTTFSQWLLNNTKYISSIHQFEFIKNGFHINNNINVDIENMLKTKTDISLEFIKNILKKYDFIFVE